MRHHPFNRVLMMLFCCVLSTSLFAQNVGINSTGTAPDSSAMLDIASSDKGLLIPRMDSTSRKNIVMPAKGLMVFDSTYNSFYFYNGNAWAAIGAGGTGSTPQDLSMSNDSLFLSNDLTAVDLSAFKQDLQFANDTLTITDGQTPIGLKSLKDNMGDHTATQNLLLNGQWLNNDNNANTPEGILVDTNGYVGVNVFPQNNFQVGLGTAATQTAMIHQFTGASLGDDGTNWQSFTATDYIHLTAFQIYQLSNSPGVAGWDYSLYEGEGTSGALLASGNSSTAVFPFNDIPLVKGQKYTVLFTETANANIYLALINPYPGGVGNGVAHYDFRFSVYGKGINTGLAVSSSGVSFENYSFPNADGTANQVLATDGASNIGWASLPTSFNIVEDADKNTKIQVEKNPNEDIIRFDLGGTQRWVMQGNRFHNSGANLFMGIDAGLSHTSGANLTAYGPGAMRSNSTGNHNTAIGASSMYTNSVGTNNTALGTNAMRSNTSGNHNTAIGTSSLFTNTIGHGNTAIGTSALQSSTEGGGNTAVGHNALFRNTTGWNNVAIGLNAMQHVTTGNRNVGVGDNVFSSTTTGVFNVGIGSSTGSGITTGSYNTLLGYEVGRTMDSGEANVMIGMYTGVNAGNVSRSTLVGYSAGSTGADHMTAIGYAAGQQSGTGGVYLGYLAGQTETGDDKLYIDNTNTSVPLIWGDFANDSLIVYGDLNINGAFTFPIVDGANGQILQTDGSGQLTWVANTGGGQTISINGNDSLFISGGNGVDLSPYLNTNTDAQDLSLSGDTLKLTNDGTTVDLSSFAGGNDDLGNHTATQDIIIGANAIQNNSSSTNGLSLGAQNQLLLETEFQRVGYFTGTGVNASNQSFGSYLEVTNKYGTRSLFGSDGDLFYSLDTLNTILGNWTTNGGITFHVNAGVKVMTLDEAGRLGIGRIATTNHLEVGGDASKTTAGNWLANSDARLKKNITSLSSNDMLNKLLSLNGVTYEWNDNKTNTKRPEGIQYGFTAQNIQSVFPTLVTEDNNGFLQTPYGTYDAMTVEAIRALNDKIEALEKENTMLKSKNKQLETNTTELAELKNAFAEFKVLLKINDSSSATGVIESEE